MFVSDNIVVCDNNWEGMKLLSCFFLEGLEGMMMKLFMVMMVVMGGWVREWRVMANAAVSVVQGDNVKPFSLLCKIYNVANHPPIKPVNTKEYQKIVDDINALSTAANGKERVNTQSEETKSAQTQLIGVTHEARKLLGEIKKVNPEGEVERARNAFNQVIFGKNGKEDLSQRGLELEPRRMTACGSKEQVGTSAGKNLIVDFFCLCAEYNENSERVAKVCGVSLGSGDGTGWGGTKLYPIATMWNEVKNGCETFSKQGVTSTQGGHFLYREFLDTISEGGKIKVNNSGTVPKHGMLGTAVSHGGNSDFNCNGKASVMRIGSAGVCVFYGNHHQEENIDWLKKFKAGLQLIDKLNTETASWQHQLTTLLNRARDLYEKVKADTQLENEEDTDDSPLAQHPNPDENENADSTTRSQRHSLLAWALLLQ
ncbi:Variant surface glycoprotein [Trypanosoma congolense IL3000]|uniref:Variant surface glycoprotein n=1 Tax=Trypanosoma congolense (strain IL3000) TaxID=1068625 RepID=F9WAW9_TRYCI|nr:Variant surface glycoprotein [Trypanosoma congolense IL3000]